MADIATLIAKWRNGLEVEIYTENYEVKYGRIKSSRFNASGEESVYYATYFHTRAKPKDNDPLLIITFEPVAGQDDFMFIETIMIIEPTLVPQVQVKQSLILKDAHLI
ncbi:hypothetical protein ACK6VY_06435 [Proteus mirabilis]|uniref:hypothetical protein n=1 Tax=Proteus mirabilis TaxID=584 RepID=UPI0039B41D19